MPPWWEITGVGLVVGVLFGLFGVGGSSFATPALGLLGIPGLIAIAAPLPAALVGTIADIRRHQVEWPVARWSVSGGVLLVPMFVVVLGLSMPESAGTSLVVIAALSIPTLATHWALGHINWTVAAAFALGSIPGAAIGSQVTQRIPAAPMKRSFGIVLIVFAVYFVGRQFLNRDDEQSTLHVRRTPHPCQQPSRSAH